MKRNMLFLFGATITMVGIQADTLADAHTLINGIKKSDPVMVYDVLNKRSIDFKECGEFDYLDFACCKLTGCIEKIEHYNEKQKKWSERVDSDYDQELVNSKITHYKAMSDKWSGLKKQVQYIVQMLAFYLGLSQENIELAEDLAEDLVEVVADVDTILHNNQIIPTVPVVQAPAATIAQVSEKIINI